MPRCPACAGRPSASIRPRKTNRTILSRLKLISLLLMVFAEPEMLLFLGIAAQAKNHVEPLSCRGIDVLGVAATHNQAGTELALLLRGIGAQVATRMAVL